VPLLSGAVLPRDSILDVQGSAMTSSQDLRHHDRAGRRQRVIGIALSIKQDII
jgi:hypothetical protein